MVPILYARNILRRNYAYAPMQGFIDGAFVEMRWRPSEVHLRMEHCLLIRKEEAAPNIRAALFRLNQSGLMTAPWTATWVYVEDHGYVPDGRYTCICFQSEQDALAAYLALDFEDEGS